MTCTAALANETVWFDKYKCDDAEQQYYERSHKLQWIESSSEVMPKAPKTEEKSQAKVEPASAKTAQAKAEPASAKTAPVQPATAQNSPLPPVSAQPAPAPTVAAQPAPAQPTQAPPVASQPIASSPAIEGLSKGEEKDASEKEVEVKKSKKSKKNKNKKNQQSAEAKGSTPPAQPQQPAEAKKASTPVDGKEPPKKAEAKKEAQQPKVEGKKEQQAQQPKAETKKEQQQQQQQQKADVKKEQQQQAAPTHEGKKGKKDKEVKKDGATLAGGDAADILARLAKLEVENKQLSKVKDDVKNLTSLLSKLTQRLEILEKGQKGSGEPAPAAPAARPKAVPQKKAAPKEEDDDINLFGSDEEDDAEKERLKAERLKMYEEKKSKKPALIAKSNIILDVKPWDDETDMKAMEAKVREVACDGLLWGASKLVPLAYGIHKLQISCVIEDEKVSVDWLQETIEANEDLVQSVDIAAFNKV